jgi:DNA/RNA endonuclease YhcR with UshA esterase domain
MPLPFSSQIYLIPLPQIGIQIADQQLNYTLMILTCIWKVLGLNLSQDTKYPDWDFHRFSQASQANDTVPH